MLNDAGTIATMIIATALGLLSFEWLRKELFQRPDQASPDKWEWNVPEAPPPQIPRDLGRLRRVPSAERRPPAAGKTPN
jgi:hypothetical protein